MSGAVVKQARPANAPVPDAQQPGQRKSIRLLMFGAIVLGVTCVQIVVTSLLMPGPAHTETDQKHEGKELAAQGRRDSKHETIAGGFAGEFAEVALGAFNFSNTTALRGVITRVDFKLTALASMKQASTLESQIIRNQERIREAVNKVVRSSNIEELYDPNLETIKRLIREEINGLLGKDLVLDVMIDDIRIVQQ